MSREIIDVYTSDVIEKAHYRLKGYVEQAAAATAQNNILAIRDRMYRDGNQLSAEVVAALNARGQAPVVFNLIEQKVNTMCGLERQQRRGIQARPRRKLVNAKAEAATHAIRYVELDQNFDTIASEVFEELCVEGGDCGVYFSLIKPVKQGKNPRIKIDRLAWAESIIDPYCMDRDGTTGARFRGRVKWLDYEYAKEAYPQFASQLMPADGTASIFTSRYDDKPVNIFYDYQRSRIAIYEVWERYAGKMYQGIFTQGVMIHYKESPYIDEDGEYFWPFEGNSAYIDKDGNRYGPVRNLIDPQDEINHRHSKAIHLMSCRQFWFDSTKTDMTVEDIQDELAKPDGGISIRDPGAFEILNTNDMMASQVQMLQIAKEYIFNSGAKPQLTDAAPSASGRAALIEQSAGIAELGTIYDIHNEWKMRCRRKIWNLQKQFWTESDWLAVLGSNKELQYIGINEPITEGDQLLEKLRAKKIPITPQIEADAAQLTNVVGIRNALPDLDVDFELDQAIDAPGIQIEQFQILSQLMQSQNLTPQRLKFLIEASALKNKQELIEILDQEQRQLQQQQNSLPPDVQQYIQQLEQQVIENRNNMQIEQLKAQTQLQKTAMDNQAKKDVEEIKGLIEILIQNQQAEQQRDLRVYEQHMSAAQQIPSPGNSGGNLATSAING